MTVILHSELLTAELPCGVYYYGGIYRAWYLGAPGSLDLPSHALWSIDDSDPVTLYGEVTPFASGDTFGPVPESAAVLEFDFTPPAPGTYTGTFTTDSDADVEDSFELEGVWEAPTDHEINYFAGLGGTISGTTPQIVADGGDGTPVTAVPDPGYRFVEWAEDSSTDPERQELNITTDLTFTAVFEAIPQYTITYTALTGGSISGDNPQTVYEGEGGTPVTAVAAAPLYAFVKWVEDDNTDPERYEENVTEDKSFTALFVYLYPNGVHVKEDAAGNCDGMDWDNAFNSLQEGMDFAHDYGIPNVLVAQGSYRP
ncbi:MAG: InlB B-repeat-containing protein, partial [Sulfurimonas sp.]|uniref:InlB B-repeat-containing protein n=1 Tax=Sulfurimonas sp. TaxID=2022749 RepID=UPI003563FD69